MCNVRRIRKKIYWNWLMASPFFCSSSSSSFHFRRLSANTTQTPSVHWQCVLIWHGKWMLDVFSQRYRMCTIAQLFHSIYWTGAPANANPIDSHCRRIQILFSSNDSHNSHVGVYLLLCSLFEVRVKTNNIRTEPTQHKTNYAALMVFLMPDIIFTVYCTYSYSLIE